MRTYRTIVVAAVLSAAWCAAQELAPPPDVPDAPAPPGAPLVAQVQTPAPPPAPVVAPVAPTGPVSPVPAVAPTPPPAPPPPAWAKDAYSRGTYYLDQRDWAHAIQAFNEVIKDQKSRVDGAYYWRAYALSKSGRRTEALRQLQTLARLYPSSSWMNDAKALQFSLQQATGQPMPPPEKLGDDELKMLALNSLIMSDPDRAVPILEKMLVEGKSVEGKQQAIFLLAQSDSPKAKELLAKLAAQSNNSPDMQRLLLQLYMMEGNTQKLLQLARNSTDPKMRGEALQMLGMAGGTNELFQLYGTEKDPTVRREIVRGLMMSGGGDKLLELSRTEKDPEVRRELIQAIGMSGGDKNGQALVSMYATETDLENKRAVIGALMMAGNSKALIELARKEKDPNLKRDLISHLGMMGGKDVSDYLVEVLK